MKLTEITNILELSPIEGADRIERAKVLGWECVVRKGLHKVGDTIVFVFPDTCIPKKLVDEKLEGTPEGDELIRLRTVKMKGQYSAGLVIPVSVLPANNYEDGQDVGELLNITKWEPTMPITMGGLALGPFPSIVSKTDEDNYRSNPRAIHELKNEERFKGQELVATTKNDGTSSTYLLDPNEDLFRVCSRSLDLKKADNLYWRIAEKYNIESIIKTYGKHLAIQGEICGPSIQKNPLGLETQEMFVFLIKNLDNNTWFSWNEIQVFCDLFSLKTVTELHRFKVEDMPSLDEMQNHANNVRYGKNHGEGLVLRTNTPIWSNVLQKNWSLKFMNQIYDSKKE